MVWIESMIRQPPAAVAQGAMHVGQVGLRRQLHRRIAKPEPLGPELTWRSPPRPEM
jgi:hypothetical protein